MTITNKSTANFIFVAIGDGSNHRCNFWQVIMRKESIKSYAKLLEHVRGKHTDYNDTVMSNYAKEVSVGWNG